MRCLAGSLVKTLLSQEIFVTSVGHLKLNSEVSPVPFLENFTTVIYSTLVQFHVRIVIGHSIKLGFLTSHANPIKVDETCELPW